MEVAQNIINIAIFIIQWQDEYKGANESLIALGPQVELVKQVVSSLDSHKYQSLEGALRALQDCLNEAKDLLLGYSKKKGSIKKIFFPANVTQQVKIIETRMHQFVSYLNLAVSVTHINHLTAAATPAPPPKPLPKPNALSFISDQETKDFWKSSFGETVLTVTCADLEKALMAKYSSYMDASALCDLRLRLDNLNTGYISCHRLSDFCGQVPLSSRLKEYTQKKHVAPKPTSPILGNDDQPITFPLLLWVDDNPDHNVNEIEYARNKGACVITLTSTSEAKQWMIKNAIILEEENPNRVRIITDNAKGERLGATKLDINAGEDIVRFVRGRRSTIPVLIYCGRLEFTKYTANYRECTATNKLSGCIAYIDQLSA